VCETYKAGASDLTDCLSLFAVKSANGSFRKLPQLSSGPHSADIFRRGKIIVTCSCIFGGITITCCYTGLAVIEFASSMKTESFSLPSKEND